MNSFHNLLVPTDFSAHSDAAMQRGADLSRRYAAPLSLLYVFQPVSYALPEGHALHTTVQMREMFDAFEKRLAQAKAEVERAGAVRVSTQLRIGPIAGEIIDFADVANVDLIVMGTHGRTGLSHLLMGSIAEKVARMAMCPVLTVRSPGAST